LSTAGRKPRIADTNIKTIAMLAAKYTASISLEGKVKCLWWHCSLACFYYISPTRHELA